MAVEEGGLATVLEARDAHKKPTLRNFSPKVFHCEFPRLIFAQPELGKLKWRHVSQRRVHIQRKHDDKVWTKIAVAACTHPEVNEVASRHNRRIKQFAVDHAV